ncbi:hypothetical protein ACIBL5_36465 [Streptomyces sp. NPDC050516]|uniref:hypothetical protein n=1 Tax=Streptomyces sp. NPDC050516 TaxID=3365621 RepID=UPI00378C5C2D
MMVCASALALLLIVVAVLALGSAFAPRTVHRAAAHRTLLALLRLAPWYQRR